MLFHFLLSAAAAATSWLCWHSWYYHTAFTLLMLLGAAYNGAHYTMAILPKKYAAKAGLVKAGKKA